MSSLPLWLVLGSAVGLPFSTPQQVWQGFDPRREPLDVQVKRAWVDAGVSYKEFTFTGETIAGEPVRVYAMYAAPEGARGLPAVLHIHGGGQTVNPSWLAFWTRRGYAAMSFNWGGRWENRAEFTRWGSFKEGNHLDAHTAGLVHPDQRASCWYHWALITRRCLTFLEQQPAVDSHRLGIFGVSMGGTLVWPVAAMDSRVKAACAIYGNGWDSYSPDRTAPDQGAADPDTRLWRQTMEAEAYAPLLRCPVLFLSATNDQHGRMDRTDDLLGLLKGPSWQGVTPNQRHHVAPEQGRNLPLFMDAFLKGGRPLPRSPGARLSVGADGVPRISVTPDAPETVTRVEAFYALGQTNPMARHWRPAPAASRGSTWSAPLPILDTRQRIYGFANVFYQSGLCLTSRLLSTIPADLGAARATDEPSLLIDDFSNGLDGWTRPGSYTDPDRDTTFLRLATGPGGRKGLSHEDNTGGHIAFCTRKIGDPKWRSPARASLSFQVSAKEANTLRVTAVENEFLPGMKAYAAVVPLAASPDWQPVTLTAGTLKTGSGEALRDWAGVTALEISADRWVGPMPVLSAFRWERPPIADKTLVAWVTVANLSQRGGSVLTLQEGSQFDGIVFGERAPGKWMAGSDNFQRTQADQSATPPETAGPGELIQVAAVYHGSEVALYRNGSEIARYTVERPAMLGKGAFALIGWRHQGAGRPAFYAGSVVDARIYAEALTPEQLRTLRPHEASAPRPLAWWDFGRGTADRMGQFRGVALYDGARLSRGRLQLDGKAAYLMTQTDTRYVNEVHFRPRTGNVGDAIPFYWKGQYHVFYLHDSRWDHVASTDLIHWKELPPALVPGEDPLGPDGEACWTGSIVERDGVFTLLYTGKNMRDPQGDQKVMAATSADLIHWQKHPDRTFYADGKVYWGRPANGAADGVPYHHQAFRDPDVFWNADRREWWMLLHALRSDGVTPCIGLYTSGDLVRWTPQPPVACYPLSVSLDCPHAAPVDGKWFIIAADHHYTAAGGPAGPYPPGMEPFEAGDVCVPKSLFDGKRRLIWGWARDLDGHTDAGAPLWGGTLSMARELHVSADGHLGERPPREIVAHFDKAVTTYEGGGTPSSDMSWEAPADYMLTCALDLSRVPSVSLVMRRSPADPASGYTLTVDAARRIVTLASRHREMSQPFVPAPDGIVRITAFVLDDVIECFANDSASLTMRAYDRSPGVVIVTHGPEAVRSLKIGVPNAR